MIKYILKRLLLFIPTLFVVSLLAFVISTNAPGDPVEILAGSASPQGGSTQISVSATVKDSIRSKLHLDKPLFYFSFTSLSNCDTLYKIRSKAHRENLARLSNTYGNWIDISNWYKLCVATYQWQNEFNVDSIFNYWNNVDNLAGKKPKFTREQINEAHINCTNLLIALPQTHEDNIIQLKLDSLKSIYSTTALFDEGITKISALQEAYSSMKNKATSWKVYVPWMHVYGLNNQYHRWISNLVLHGEFGYSYADKELITDKIWTKFWISFKLIFLSVLLAYLISIPIGVYSAKKKGSFFDRSVSLILFMLYSLPSFFVGMMLLYFFANPDFVVWFPEAGYMDPNTYQIDAPLYQRWLAEAPYMVLPLITYTYSSFAFISRIMRSSMLDNLNQDYIRTARAKGLSENQVLWKHAYGNSLLPMITLFVNIFPMAIGGSVIIETIFTYPGMGLASFEAIHNYDYPTIVAIFTLAGFLTMLAYLVADILYAIADPRITYTKR